MAATSVSARELERSGIYDHVLDLETRLRELETMLSDLTDRERSHLRAKQRDAREHLNRGETVEIVVIDSLPSSDKVRSKIDGIHTFVNPNTLDLSEGDAILARIADVGVNHAEAIALEKFGGKHQ